MSGWASGKVILLGEHAVVYGVPAIVVGIERGARAHTVELEPSATSELVLSAAHADANETNTPVRVHVGDGSDLARAFGALLEACGASGGVRVEATTDLPAAAGLGCSAALGVAIARALDARRGDPPKPVSEVVGRAMAWERVFHGNPSGVDAAAAARGGCLWYERRDAGALLREIRLGSPLRLAIGHTGIASSTRTMVEHVAQLRERKRELVERTFEGIQSLAQNARLAIEARDVVGLGRLMDLNQMLLSGLMLSTEEIEVMCRLARDAGALGAKLTGSGGGGCVVALVENDASPVLAAWKSAGYRGFATEVRPADAAEGPRSEAP